MPNINTLPLANLEKHGARLVPIDNRGFVIEPASGGRLGLFDWPPESMFLETHTSTVDPPKPLWAPQKMLEAYCEFDAANLALGKDQRLSDYGRAERLLPVRQRAAMAMSHVLNDLAKHESEVAQLEVQRYAVPGMRPDDYVGALRDNEIRTVVRGMPEDERGELMRSLNKGEDRALLEAILRSPVKTGRLEGLALNGWRELRDREDPDGRMILNLAKEHNEWARRITGAVRGALTAKLAFKGPEFYEIVKEFGAEPFFDSRQIFEFERWAKMRAARA